MTKENMQFETSCIHAGQSPDKLYGGVSVPIYQSSTFAFENADQGAARFGGTDAGYKYTRLGNPTTSALEECVATLEGGGKALATASGMAAISTVFMAFLSKGAHIVSTDSVYGPTRTLLEREFSRFGVQATFVDTSDLEALKKAIKPETKLVYVETPSNPTLSITDISAAAAIAHQAGALLVVDNTFCSPMLQKPLDLGADVVLHSMSKFLNGHSDVIAGILVARKPELYATLKSILVQIGGTIDPHQAWLVLRGVKTMGMRIRVAQENALRLAEEIGRHPAVAEVKYPGLPSHPQFALAKIQMKGPGTLISFELKGGVEAGRTLMNSVALCTLAVSLGSVETLIQHPASMTHASVGEINRRASGITDGLIRLSVGCEEYDDIRKDLLNALDQISLNQKGKIDFDKKARDWDANPVTVERTKAIADAIRGEVPFGKTCAALEYGCGTGLLSFHFQPHLDQITLADTSNGMLDVLREKIAKNNVRNMTPLKLDFLSEPLPKMQFDLIYTAMTLHHVDDTGKILGIFRDLLKPSGYLCIADLDSEDGTFHEDEFHGHLGFDRDNLRKKLLEQKFERIRFSTVYKMTKEGKGQKKVYPIFLVLAQMVS